MRKPLPHTVLLRQELTSFGSVAEMRALGVTHVVADESVIRAFSNASSGNRNANRDLVALQQSVFRDLAEQSEVVWRAKGPFGGRVAAEVSLRRLLPEGASGTDDQVNH